MHLSLDSLEITKVTLKLQLPQVLQLDHYFQAFQDRYELKITCYKSGCSIEIDDLVFEPPRNGPTLWEIGIPDRSAREFYIPDPDPKYINKLFVNHPDKLSFLLLHR